MLQDHRFAERRGSRSSTRARNDHLSYLPGGFLDIGEELRAVPWSAFDAPVSRTGARLDVSSKQPQESYKITDDTLGDLTKPTVIAQVTDYWAPLTAQDERTGGKSGREGMSQGESKKAAASGEQKNDGQQGTDRSAARNKSAAGEARKDEQGVPHILVGRGVITTIVAPQVSRRKNWRGRASGAPMARTWAKSTI
jgi:hypothetical protein